MLWREHVVFSRTSVPPLDSVIFHFSYLLHLEGCHRDVCSAALQEGFSGLQRKSLRLVLNSPVTMSLSCV